ncbi:MAG: DUF4359 domain-containing protein [Flavobacteriales bacterium]|uniref:DUF4359 domain-containing protein n=1 Tax=Sanyastnella coralliicola TaxID=3069118 RepID=UPI0027BA4536|nr:DUF4359 domain-containing protein [Longitalea sp. SCSIO 12813]MCH2200064.1 DUF4359 domain-containing protein [Flavobacteriales bacterium]
MKRFLPILIIALVAMFLTNPDREDFKVFVAERLEDRMLEGSEGNDIAELFGSEASKIAAGVAEKMAERKNFYIFSLYEIPMGTDTFRYVGIFKIFIPLQEKQPLNL